MGSKSQHTRKCPLIYSFFVGQAKDIDFSNICCNLIDMQITDEQLGEFIALYKQEFGEELTGVEAQQSLLSLLRLMSVSVSPLENKAEL